MEQLINKLCYRQSDRDIIQQLMEQAPSNLIGYTSIADWRLRGLSYAASKNMSDLIQIARKIIHYYPPFKIEDARGVVEYIHPLFGCDDVERFYIAILNNGNRVIRTQKISDGGITGVTIDIKILIKECLSYYGTGIILCHNHPSGNLTPSSLDIELTNRVVNAAKLFDIRVVDHVIITKDKRRFYSFVENGDL